MLALDFPALFSRLLSRCRPLPGFRLPLLPRPSPGSRLPLLPRPSPGSRLPLLPRPSPGSRLPLLPCPSLGSRLPLLPRPSSGPRLPLLPSPSPRNIVYVLLLTSLLAMSIYDEDLWQVDGIMESPQQSEAEEANEESVISIRRSSRLASKKSIPSMEDWPVPKLLEVLFKNNIPAPVGASHEELFYFILTDRQRRCLKHWIYPPRACAFRVPNTNIVTCDPHVTPGRL